ncbi:MAG: N-6 DNA methylase [Candidatus Falkowbacteria bacterium]|nr:N-6 DNA methylase [Candidatus Falkowbacteria bacterium]
MLDQTTKRKIDSARQILVGKVPDPKAQVEQITTALVYKFMDDMDKESEELGGEAKFFADNFSQYSWTKLLDNKLSGQERLNLYDEAISNMSKNPHIPQLFRDIFKGAFLPYRDARTLMLFLKEINEFTYENSENLGNAFEYLLSILGSQGDAGQFRTPRHIIDFVVDVVDPKKNETILDPACGTAGFLISAYKHILKENMEIALTPDEKLRLMSNLVGYDISPDMVKLALVNMYLHGFPQPKIHEYDTLTSEKRWDETFDVILANPPFMTPNGGIVPHKRFAVQSGKAEALFVDYILEHLSIHGKGGVVIPEGILENYTKDFTKIRKMLIENGLYAIVSLPVGTFNPYSGSIKTSIIFFDRKIKTDSILHYEVRHDGFDLGRNRNPIKENDLPEAKKLILALAISNKKVNSEKAFYLDKKEVLENDGISLNRISYKKESIHDSYKSVELGELFEVEKGTVQSSKNVPGEFTFITASEEWKTHNEFSHECEAIIFAMGASGSLGRTHYINGKFIASDLCFILTPSKKYNNKIDLNYYNNYFVLMRDEIIKALARGAAKKAINQRNFKKYKVPYPEYSEQLSIMKKVNELNVEIDKEEKEIQDRQNAIAKLKEKVKNYIL